MSPHQSIILSACLAEATFRKPGNVHPLRSFSDCDWEAFDRAAQAISQSMTGNPQQALGECILNAVTSTQEHVGSNLNLGIILLIAPLSIAPDPLLPETVGTVLNSATVDDCRQMYSAIRKANPGGLGQVNAADVRGDTHMTILESMQLAADRDQIARQYVTDFDGVFQLSRNFTANTVRQLEAQVVKAYLQLIASEPESLIQRKCGRVVAEQAMRMAQDVLYGAITLTDFDNWLRADGNRRNPGTAADLIAGAIYIAMRTNRIPIFPPDEIGAYGQQLQASDSILADYWADE